MPEEQKKTAYRKVVRNPQTGRLEVWFFDSATHRRITDLSGYTLESQNPYEVGGIGGGSGGSGSGDGTDSGGDGNSGSRNRRARRHGSRAAQGAQPTGTISGQMQLGALDFVTGGRASQAISQISQAARTALDWAAPPFAEPTRADENGRVVPSATVDRANATQGATPFVAENGTYYGQGIMVSGNVDLSRVDPALVQILNEAAMRSPYIVALNNTGSGSQSVNTGPGSPRSALSNHQPDEQGQSAGIDIVLIDPVTHQRLPNYQNADAFRAYETFAQTARLVQMRDYPELSGKFRWGGYFTGTHYGDLMHFDMDRMGYGMAGGSWENGANAALMAHMPGLKSNGMGRVLPSQLDDIYPMIYQGPTPVERKIMQVEREGLEQSGFLIQRDGTGNVTNVKRPMTIPESDVDVDRIIMQAHLQAYNEERTGDSGAFDLYGRTMMGPTLARSVMEQANRKVNTVFVDSAGNEVPMPEDQMAGYNAMPSDYRPQVLVNGQDFNQPPSVTDRFFELYGQRANAPRPDPAQTEMDRMLELYEARATERKQVDPFSESPEQALERLRMKRDGDIGDMATTASSYLNDFSEDDIRSLATVAYWETDWRNPPEIAQQQFEGNLQVMMNRTINPLFPDTVENMLNQRSQTGTWQFESVGNRGGVANMGFPLPELEAQAIGMATDYMSRLKNGETPAVGGALNFANPYASDESNREWIDALDGPTIGSGQFVHKYGTATGTPTQFQFITDQAPIPADKPEGWASSSRVPTKGVLEPRTASVTLSTDTLPTGGFASKPSAATGRAASPARDKGTSRASSNPGFAAKPSASATSNPSSTPKVTTPTTKEAAKAKEKAATPKTTTTSSPTYEEFKDKQRLDLGV